MASRAPVRREVDGGIRAGRGQSVQVGSREQLSGIGHRQIAEIQRSRILSAVLVSANERGTGNMSVANVVECSGVSRRTFYELFENREDCFFAAFEQALSRVSQLVIPAYRGEKEWRDRVRAALVALLAFFDEEPVIGRVLIVESLGGGARAVARRTEVIEKLASAVEEGAVQGKSSPLPLTGEGVVGGALAVIQARLAQVDHRESLVELTNPLMSMIVLPFLGVGAARRELRRAVPEPVSGSIERAIVADPFKEAGMRLTYRTVRVLMAIAERPGASNRTVGDIAEIRDQGQISKLLNRLEQAGMATNTGLGAGAGAPNAWTLTPLGHQVVEGVRAHMQTTGEGPQER